MNTKRFKVTVRVFDHPPRPPASVQQRQQGMSESEQLNSKAFQATNSLENHQQPVYRSSIKFQVPDQRNVDSHQARRGGNVVRNFTPGKQASGHESQNSNEKLMNEGCAIKLDSKAMSNCEASCRTLRPEQPQLIDKIKPASLNINKLHRNNAVDDDERFHNWEERGSHDVVLDCSARFVTPRSCEATNSSSWPPQQSKVFCTKKGKRGLDTWLNGCTSELSAPLNDTHTAQRFRRKYSNGMTMNMMSASSTPNYGLCDDGLTGMDGRELDGRPRLIREGSTCSSDSIITEIEAISDEELMEIEPGCCSSSDCRQQLAAAQEQDNPPVSPNHWKKIRSMIHWQPFAKNYKKKYPWVQLAGHQGNFKAGECGTILKKTNDVEREILIKLMKDVLKPFVPEFKREVENHEERYLVMQDLLCGFESPSVMDCKMGVRTFLEDELEKARMQPKLRKDLYQKMIEVDPNAPTEVERDAGAITKPRYMKWREDLSSSSSLGFRIEGIKKSGERPNKDFKTTRTASELGEKFRCFIDNDANIKLKYLERLETIRSALESSQFFKFHEVIGSSLLFVHDSRGNVNIWMIDFAKTHPLPDGILLTHRKQWDEGNHEDGYLFGLDNMISIWGNL